MSGRALRAALEPHLRFVDLGFLFLAQARFGWVAFWSSGGEGDKAGKNKRGGPDEIHVHQTRVQETHANPRVDEQRDRDGGERLSGCTPLAGMN
jgi:hypothetical protein